MDPDGNGSVSAYLLNSHNAPALLAHVLFAVPVTSRLARNETGVEFTCHLELGGAVEQISHLRMEGGGWTEQLEATEDEDGADDLDLVIPEQLIAPAMRGSVRQLSELNSIDADAFESLSEYLWAELGDLLLGYEALVNTGWLVTIDHPRVEGADAVVELVGVLPSNIDDVGSQNIWASLGTRPGDLRFRWSYVEGAWKNNVENTGIRDVEGRMTRFPSTTLSIVARLVAPDWALAEWARESTPWHSEGAPVSNSSLPSALDDEVKPSVSQIAHRSAAVAKWADREGFLEALLRPTEKLLRNWLDGNGLSGHGYYVLEFTDGQCYVGQSTNLPHRIGYEHSRTFRDIKSVRLLPDPDAEVSGDPRRHLLDREYRLIHSVQGIETLARNKAEMTIIKGKRALDNLISIEDQRTWLLHPDAANASEGWSNRSIDPDEFAGAAASYRHMRKDLANDSRAVVEIVRRYLARCLPFPLRTEGVYWSLSCTAGIDQERVARVCLTVSWTEMLTIAMNETTGALSGFVLVNDFELFGAGDGGWDYISVLRRHPGVLDRPSPHRQPGPQGTILEAVDLDSLLRLLNDPAVTRAAASAALHVMRKGKTPASMSNGHCPQLVSAALVDLGTESASN